jgi:preprotein translocase subunit SecD
MNKSLYWRLTLVSAAVVLAVILFIPSMPGVNKTDLPKWWLGNKINLGLDLQGGIPIYQVQTDKAVESHTPAWCPP